MWLELWFHEVGMVTPQGAGHSHRPPSPKETPAWLSPRGVCVLSGPPHMPLGDTEQHLSTKTELGEGSLTLGLGAEPSRELALLQPHLCTHSTPHGGGRALYCSLSPPSLHERRGQENLPNSSYRAHPKQPGCSETFYAGREEQASCCEQRLPPNHWHMGAAGRLPPLFPQAPAARRPGRSGFYV